jgi:hypothetical protein
VRPQQPGGADTGQVREQPLINSLLRVYIFTRSDRALPLF